MKKVYLILILIFILLQFQIIMLGIYNFNDLKIRETQTKFNKLSNDIDFEVIRLFNEMDVIIQNLSIRIEELEEQNPHKVKSKVK